MFLAFAYLAQTYVYLPRSKWLHWSRITLFVVIAFAYGAGIVYVADQVRFGMPTEQAPRPAPATTPQASVPEKPTFPSNRVIKEGREPGRVATIEKMEKK